VQVLSSITVPPHESAREDVHRLLQSFSSSVSPSIPAEYSSGGEEPASDGPNKKLRKSDRDDVGGTTLF
jgi:hypothetical protein